MFLPPIFLTFFPTPSRLRLCGCAWGVSAVSIGHTLFILFLSASHGVRIRVRAGSESAAYFRHELNLARHSLDNQGETTDHAAVHYVCFVSPWQYAAISSAVASVDRLAMCVLPSCHPLHGRRIGTWAGSGDASLLGDHSGHCLCAWAFRVAPGKLGDRRGSREISDSGLWPSHPRPEWELKPRSGYCHRLLR